MSNMMSLHQSLSLLGLRELPTLDHLSEIRQRALLASHPDKGGDAETFRLANDAIRIVKQTIEQSTRWSYPPVVSL
jgi:hypothetical protein